MDEVQNRYTDAHLLSAMSRLKKKMELQRLPMINEKATQAELAAFLEKEGYTFSREHRLYSKDHLDNDAHPQPKVPPDIPDFLIQVGEYSIVLEVKLRARRTRIYNQLLRYAKHDTVHAVLLLTGTSMTLPLKIKQKPALVISLGRGWL